MRLTKTLSAVIALLATLSLCSDAQAIDRPGKFTLRPFIGGYAFEGNQDLDNAPVFGVGAGYNFGDNWGGEFSFGYIPSGSTVGEGDVDGYLFQLNGLYHFMPGSLFQPYVSAGSGALVLDKERGDTKTRFLMNFSGGVEYFVTDYLAVHGELEYILVLGPTSSNFMYTAGVTLYFNSRTLVKSSE